MKKIKFVIKKKGGQVIEETDGFTGRECLDATQTIRDSLGIGDAQIQEKDEMYLEPATEDTLVKVAE